MKAIILAGGVGERFWPLSTPKTPKQFLKLFGHESLIKQTFERLKGFVKPRDIYVITSLRYIDETAKELPELPLTNIIGEPERKNTAPACYIGTLMAKETEIVLTVPADHYIYPQEDFRATIEKGIDILNEHEVLLTIGIKPTRAETGYGYIESEKSVDHYRVLRFHEKPNIETANKYLTSDRFFWNSGMFLWRKEVFLSEMAQYAGEIHALLHSIDPMSAAQLTEAYPRLPAISIDYALMEKSKRIMMVPASFHWSDMGNWESIRELEGYSLSEDNLILHHSENVFVRSNAAKPIIILGARDLFVIDTEQGLLVAQKEHLPNLREAIRMMTERPQPGNPNQDPQK